MPTVKITVTLECGHTLVYFDEIEEKYPFACEEEGCDYVCAGPEKYPWTLSTQLWGDE